MVPFGMKIELHGYDFLRERKNPGLLDGQQPVPVRHAEAAERLEEGRTEARSSDLKPHYCKFEEINEGYVKLKGGEGCANSSTLASPNRRRPHPRALIFPRTRPPRRLSRLMSAIRNSTSTMSGIRISSG